MSAFAQLLKEWRKNRRYSQLDLSVAAGISSRHISFLESARAMPSRSMVMRLSDTLQMPRVTTNAALLSAGFAPSFPDLTPDHESLAAVRDAISTLLGNHMPMPALAFDRHWCAIDANPAANLLMSALGAEPGMNLIDLLIRAAEPGSALLNWTQVARLALIRLRTEIVHTGGDAELSRLYALLDKHPRWQGSDTADAAENTSVICMRIQHEDIELCLFSMVAQFGSVQEISLGDTRIELFFPQDEKTREFFVTVGD